MDNLMETACRRNQPTKNQPKQAYPFLKCLLSTTKLHAEKAVCVAAGCLCLTTCRVLIIRLLANPATWGRAWRVRRGTLTFTCIHLEIKGPIVYYEGRGWGVEERGVQFSKRLKGDQNCYCWRGVQFSYEIIIIIIIIIINFLGGW